MSVGDQSYINKYINMSLHEFATRSKHYGVQMYENVVNTDRIVFSELRQTDNDWDFEDIEAGGHRGFTSQNVTEKGSEYNVCMFQNTIVMQRINSIYK